MMYITILLVLYLTIIITVMIAAAAAIFTPLDEIIGLI